MIKTNKKHLYPLCLLLSFFLGFETGAFQLSTLSIAHEFEVGSGITGLIISVQYIAVALGSLIMGGVSDLIGKKKVLSVFIPLFALGCFIAGTSISVFIFVLGVFILGIAYSTIEAIIGAALADTNPLKSEKQIVKTQFTFSMGAVSGPLVLDWLMGQGYDWRIGFTICAIAFVALLPQLMITQITHTEPVVFADRKTSPGETQGFKQFFKPYFILLFFSIMIYVGIEASAVFYADPLISVELNTPEYGAYAISAFWLAMALARFFHGRKEKDARKIINRSQFITVLLLLVLAFNQNPVISLIVFLVAGYVFGPIWPLLISLAVSEYPNNSGRASGLMLVASGTGGAVVVFLLGFVADFFGFQSVYLACAIIALIIYLWFKNFDFETFDRRKKAIEKAERERRIREEVNSQP